MSMVEYVKKAMKREKKSKGAAPVSASVRIRASREIRARQMVEGDAFEGWINSLQYDYERPEGADFVIVNVPKDQLAQRLRDEEWTTMRRNDIHQMSKGEHSVVLEEAGDGKTKIIDYKD